MIEFDLSSICEMQRRMDFNPYHASNGQFTSANGSGGGLSKSSGKKMKSLPMTAKEKAKVSHDINSLYHANYEGKKYCIIKTRSNRKDSPFYLYRFVNGGFDNYDIYSKEDYD